MRQRHAMTWPILRSRYDFVRAGVLIFGFVAIGVSPCSAQMALSSSDGRSLGGYGGSILDTRPEIGTTATLIPYGGAFSGFMPYRMGGGRSLAFEPRERAIMDAGRTPFRLTPMPIGRGLGGGLPISSPLAVPQNRSVRGTSSVMPPNFGSPFRPPPSLISPSTTGSGMSM